MNKLPFPEMVVMPPTDNISMERVDLDNLISILGTGLEINNCSALSSAVSSVKYKLEIIARQNEILPRSQFERIEP